MNDPEESYQTVAIDESGTGNATFANRQTDHSLHPPAKQKMDHNLSVQHLNNKDADLSFEEDDPLIDSDQKAKKMNATMLNKSDTFSQFYTRSDNPESESQLSMRHLSEGGKAMRTTDPVSS